MRPPAPYQPAPFQPSRAQLARHLATYFAILIPGLLLLGFILANLASSQ